MKACNTCNDRGYICWHERTGWRGCVGGRYCEGHWAHPCPDCPKAPEPEPMPETVIVRRRPADRVAGIDEYSAHPDTGSPCGLVGDTPYRRADIADGWRKTATAPYPAPGMWMDYATYRVVAQARDELRTKLAEAELKAKRDAQFSRDVLDQYKTTIAELHGELRSAQREARDAREWVDEAREDAAKANTEAGRLRAMLPAPDEHGMIHIVHGNAGVIATFRDGDDAGEFADGRPYGSVHLEPRDGDKS